MTPTLSVETKYFLAFIIYSICIFGLWCVFVYTLAEIMLKFKDWITEDKNDSDVDI